jgi:DNA-binding transcriptional LysR family regulator
MSVVMLTRLAVRRSTRSDRHSDGVIGESDGSMGGVDSRRLRAFVTVAELGGISAAAERLGYAQSSLSAQLRSLEAELGVAVIHRTNTGVTLTEAGVRLLPFARDSLELDEQMRRAVTGGRPRVRIGALESLADEWLPDILHALDQGAAGSAAPADVTLTVGGRDRLTTDLAAGVLDLVFLYDNATPTAGPHAVVAHDRVLLVAAADHPLVAAGPVEPHTLLGTEFLIAEPGCTTQMLVDRFGRDLTARTPVSMVTGSLAALRRMASYGRGVALLPSLTASRSLQSGELVEIPVAGGLPVVGIEARWRERLEAAQPAVTALLRLARRHQPLAFVDEPVERVA